MAGGPPIERGDCGVILKADGSHRVFSTGMEDVTPETMTDAQREQGKRMVALSFALNSERIMAILYDLIEDPEITDHDKIARAAH